MAKYSAFFRYRTHSFTNDAVYQKQASLQKYGFPEPEKPALLQEHFPTFHGHSTTNYQQIKQCVKIKNEPVMCGSVLKLQNNLFRNTQL
ncbi:hypothetical protein D1614_18050 [Maribellus luteus]|uniref:Uncharacterized protein n=1 Tax=Maribellus luteus TaxID=2305463 RepID=A0A399SWN2_9BACT|nr:hypothetical protein D1614_18050 [Maribellus luteus]